MKYETKERIAKEAKQLLFFVLDWHTDSLVKKRA